jgi:hypothetical protein
MDAPIYRFDRYEPPRTQTPAPAGLALEITRGQARQRLRPIRERVFLIGTASDCDLVLGDLTFPESYAYLFVAGEQVTIRRLGCGPEMFVCGEQVEMAELYRGDVVTFGPFAMRLVTEGERAGTTAEVDRAADGPHGPHSTPIIRVFDPGDATCQA